MDKYCHKNKCIKSTTLPMCSAENLEPKVVHGPVIVKLPVVLADSEIQIDIEAIIKIGEAFLEIKRVKKNVFLTQCKLLSNAGKFDHCNDKFITGKLFLKGFVEKNIEYVVIDNGSRSKDCNSGKVKSISAKVPFDCVTEVTFLKQPVINKRSRLLETDYLCDESKRNKCFNSEEELMGKSFCETEFEEHVVYVEQPYCELDSAKIFEVDTIIGQNCDSFNENTEDESERESVITEKMVILLRVKLLQQQLVSICSKS